MAALALVALAQVACATDPGAAAPALPGWLQSRITRLEAATGSSLPGPIWQITHDGAPAYYFRAPCCDQFNELLDAKGRRLCSPDGGFTGRGDMKCPRPADAGTEARLVWGHPKDPEQHPVAPGVLGGGP